MKVLYSFLPKKRVYGVPTFLTIESRTYSAGSFLWGGTCGGCQSVSSLWAWI